MEARFKFHHDDAKKRPSTHATDVSVMSDVAPADDKKLTISEKLKEVVCSKFMLSDNGAAQLYKEVNSQGHSLA